MRTLAFATFLIWWLRTGACGVGACGFWRFRMPPPPLCLNRDIFVSLDIAFTAVLEAENVSPLRN